MRWLFIGLVILNIFYFIWSRQDFAQQGQQLHALTQESTAGAQQVKLLSEAARDEAQEDNSWDDETPAEELLLGGFADEATVLELQQRLFSLDIASKVEAIDSQVDVEYWVYMEPLPSRQASVRLLNELQARGIDGYLISQGDLLNGISLGMFSRDESAQAVVIRLNAAGYEASIKPIERVQRLYWLLVDARARRLVDETLLQQLATDFIDMQHLLRPANKNGH